MKEKLSLLIIIILACFLRFYQIGEVPISPDWDEVALGYNAYSILLTGKDEFGEFLPVILRSFEDYKPALYAYLIIPLIPIFGLTVTSVRLPSAIMGIVGVIIVYFFTREIFMYKSGDRKSSDFYKKARIIALSSALIMAISPWHLQFSRVAFESNTGLTLNLLMAFFFLRGFRSPHNFTISVIFGALSIYTYQSEKVFTPLLLIGLIIIFRSEIKKINRKYFISAVVTGVFILSPMIFNMVNNPETLTRARGVSIFSDETTLLKKNAERLINFSESKDYIGLVFNNRRVVYIKTFIANYISHYDFVWLFIKGDFDINRHHAPHMALFYIIELPLLLMGVHRLIFGNFPKQTKGVLVCWILIAPLPASITQGVPHAVRTLNMLPPFLICIAIGHYALCKFILRYRYLFIPVYTIVIMFFSLNFLYYLDQYFIQQNYEYALDWQYGYEDIVKFSESTKENYHKIVVSNKGEMSQSYIFFLFYMKYSPKLYLENGGTLTGGIEKTGNKFDIFEFRTFDYYKESPGTLLIGSSADFPEEFNVLHAVNYPDGSIAKKAVLR